MLCFLVSWLLASEIENSLIQYVNVASACLHKSPQRFKRFLSNLFRVFSLAKSQETLRNYYVNREASYFTSYESSQKLSNGCLGV